MPVILAGMVGLPMIIVLVRGAEVNPQGFVYVTLMLPPVNVPLNVTVMLLPVLDPLALAGNVQL
jgi:hypothetical protein